jgi:2-(1,2-epoxy-1,2-dihydrophenyl)acetyl-CoA isomerase
VEQHDEVTVEVADAVATVTMNRPAALNALTAGMKERLLDALAGVAVDPRIRAVVLTGAGRAFCVGQDLREHAGALESGAAALDTVRRHYNPLILTLTRMPKPVVAAVSGAAAGAGAGLAFACDFRVVGRGATFLMAFARVGLTGDSGTSWLLPRLVGQARAAELLMLAEPVTAETAEHLGLVTRLVPDDQVAATAGELAAQLADGPTLAYAAIKESLVFAAGHGLAEALDREADLQQRCGRTADHREATAAFVAKRPVGFTGR